MSANLLQKKRDSKSRRVCREKKRPRRTSRKESRLGRPGLGVPWENPRPGPARKSGPGSRPGLPSLYRRTPTRKTLVPRPGPRAPKGRPAGSGLSGLDPGRRRARPPPLAGGAVPASPGALPVRPRPRGFPKGGRWHTARKQRLLRPHSFGPGRGPRGGWAGGPGTPCQGWQGRWGARGSGRQNAAPPAWARGAAKFRGR